MTQSYGNKEQNRQELLDFANMVFSMSAGSTDFEALLPKAYAEDNYDNVIHHTIREEGALRALIDVYPLTLETRGHSLKCAYIGTVSVHPAARHKGCMNTLMQEVDKELRAQGYDLILLDGIRHRYQHYGFEKAGIKYCFNITTDSIRHSCAGRKEADGLSLLWIEDEEDALLDKIYDIYRTRHVSARTRETFYQTLKSWEADICAIMQADVCIGYLNTSAQGDAIYEIGLQKPELLPDIIRLYMSEQQPDELGVNVGTDETQLLPQLERISDYYTMSMSHQMKILQYERVLEFLFAWKMQYAALAEGSFIISIKGQQMRLKTLIKDAQLQVVQTKEPADVELDELEFVKLLTTSYYYTEILQESSPLRKAPQGWLPLPFFLPEADAF